jgi:hypothetical protein
MTTSKTAVVTNPNVVANWVGSVDRDDQADKISVDKSYKFYLVDNLDTVDK